MGGIADAVVARLGAGPAGADALGEALRREGRTRAREPAAAVRRAVRDDPRVIQIADGRLASVAQALSGVHLTRVLTEDEAAAGVVEVEPDLAPLAMIGIWPSLPLPPGVRAGDAVEARVEDPERGGVSLLVRRAPPGSRSRDEAALLAAVADRLPDGPSTAPPVTHLATVAVSVAATTPTAFRGPGRPLSEVLAGAGYEVHLGWVGPRGTEWASLTEEEVDALESDVAELIADELPAEAALAQQRLVAVLRRHLPERVPAARRRLARTLARAGRPADALAQLTAAFGEDDPEDHYEAALLAYRTGDEVSARRWVEAGLARCEGPARGEVAECLADIGGDLDAQAAFLRLRAGVDEIAPDADGAGRVARAVLALDRSYLVEAMVEEVLRAIEPADLDVLVACLGEAGDDGQEACLAFAAILAPELAAAARRAAGPTARARRPAVAGLTQARASAAWATSPADAPDQQQVVVTVAKEGGRVSPLVVLIDVDELGGAVKDAFFLPDLAAARLRRELLDPVAELGIPCAPLDLDEASASVAAALDRTARIGWRIPSLAHQPVLERIDRWLLRPERGGALGRRA
jgi:hypothetical protein